MPDGSIWQPSHGGGFDRLLDGVAENKQAVLGDLGGLAHIRDPLRCPVELLPDLEREFGVTANIALTERERRMAVAIIRYKRVTLPTTQKLQRVLDMAGFGSGGYGLTVTPNASPPTDPFPIVGMSCNLTAHGFPSIFCAGNTDVAFAGYGGGYYLVSGDHFMARQLYPQAGQICARVFDGSDYMSGRERAGYHEDFAITNEAAQHKTPPEAYWPLIFFVGGTVTRNGDGSIGSVAMVSVPATRRQELHRLVLRVAPMGIWAAMMVGYF